MEKIYKKYFNDSCSPEEFAEILKRFQDPTRETEIVNVMVENWNNVHDEEKLMLTNQRLLDQIHQKIATKKSQKGSFKKNFSLIGMKVAAILIVALLITSIIWINKQSQTKQENITQNILAPYGTKAKLTLPDGSTVWLNSGTKIFFPKKFGKERRIELKGEAFFDVVKNGKPFLVNTTHGLIKVLGTAFDVKSYDNDNFQTTLIRGSIKLQSHDINQGVILKPGQQATFDKNKNICVNQVDTELYTSWKDGKLIFYHEPLCSVIKKLERNYNVKIVLKDKKIENLEFSGIIEKEPFSEILQLLAKTSSIKYTYDTQNQTFIINSK